ncbi:hypothetical protein JB92DRAFT_2915308 [Gautieria morchelliformis]|nr:hypothetical protein JB92DRAFT_2915308 [Gautieria morchelliformis]
MDPSRTSNVSSFYDSGGRRGSLDANYAISHQQPPTMPVGHRPRMDSSTSSAYYNPNRLSQNSADLLTGDMGPPGQRGTAGSAGYNRTSFFAPGREAPVKGGTDEQLPLHQGDLAAGGPDEGWDVYADFNNAGPRYSTAFANKGTGYHQIPVGASKPGGPGSESTTGPVELVTVPALGAEWKASELRDMTKSGKREVRNEKLAAKWRSFRRDENGFCGIKWLTRRLFVLILFGVCCVVGILLAFTVPRVPGFAFNADTPITGGNNVVFSRTPANFSFDTKLNLQVDTNSNFLPLHFNSIHAQVFESDTNKQIAAGDLPGTTVPAKAFSPIIFPLTFNYTAVNDTDQTWLNVYDACRNPQNVPPNQSRPPLKLRVNLQMFIAGLIQHPTASTAINSAPCPFQLPTNSV